MKLISHEHCLKHTTGNHPESPERITTFGNLPNTEIPMSESLITLVHTPEYIARVKEASVKSEFLDTDTPTSPGTYEAAVAAATLTVEASKRGDFALVRPPGHHAFPDKGRGFCIFNNMAIATSKLVSEGKRVLIVDFDGHFGDGTAHVFYKTNKVLYISTHQLGAYPHAGTTEEIGEAEGKGFTINIPLPPESGDDAYAQTLEIIPKLIEQFAPDTIAVSAGFDGYYKDPLLALHLTTNSYYRIGTILGSANKPIFATLEGGYSTADLPACVGSFLNGINGEANHTPEDPSESRVPILEATQETIALLKETVHEYWKL